MALIDYINYPDVLGGLLKASPWHVYHPPRAPLLGDEPQHEFTNPARISDIESEGRRRMGLPTNLTELVNQHPETSGQDQPASESSQEVSPPGYSSEPANLADALMNRRDGPAFDVGANDPSYMSTRSGNTYTAKPSAPTPMIQNLGQLHSVMQALANVPDELKTNLLSLWTGIPLTSQKVQALNNAIATVQEKHRLDAPERMARLQETIKRDRESAIMRRDMFGLQKSAHAERVRSTLERYMLARETLSKMPYIDPKFQNLPPDQQAQHVIPHPSLAVFDKEINRMMGELDKYHESRIEAGQSDESNPSGNRTQLPANLQQLQDQGYQVELQQ
mgnify:CR=1 FL=1